MAKETERKEIKLPVYGIIVTLDADGKGGAIVSELHEELDEDVEGGSEEDMAHDRHDGAMDGIESLILGHACAGIDIAAPEYVEGIRSAVEACGNNI